MARRRHLSRIAVMQTLFETAMRNGDVEIILQKNIEELGRSDVDEEFATTLLTGATGLRDDIINALATYAPQWPLERMDPVSRATLIMSAYELLFANDAPPAVVMDEAIEIAKEYGTPESGKFVNGVLNAIAHK